MVLDPLSLGGSSVEAGVAIGSDTLSSEISSIERGTKARFDMSSADVSLEEDDNAPSVDRQVVNFEAQGCKRLLGNEPIGSNRSWIATSRSRDSCFDGLKNGRAT